MKLSRVSAIAGLLLPTMAIADPMPALHRRQTSSDEVTATPTAAEQTSSDATAEPTSSDASAVVTSADSSQQTDDALIPWISVDKSKSITTTITPYVTTNTAGETTTVDAATTGVSFTNATDGVRAFQCTPENYSVAPLCMPSNGSLWYVGQQYEITWDEGWWRKDLTEGSVRFLMKFIDDLGEGESELVWDSDEKNILSGLTTLKIEKDWMNKQDNRTVQISVERIFPSSSAKTTLGPIIILTNGKKPNVEPVRSKHKPFELFVILPITLIILLSMVWAVFHFNRGQRAIDRAGLRARMGKKRFRDKFKFKKSGGAGGYGERKSRAQRMKGAPMSPASDDGEDDWEMADMADRRGRVDTSAATGVHSGVTRERKGPANNNNNNNNNNPFSDNYAG